MIFIAKNNSIRLLFLFILSICIYSCDPDEEFFSLTIDFKHLVDDMEVVYGNDNLTLDGSGIRDFLNINDLVDGHCAER